MQRLDRCRQCRAVGRTDCRRIAHIPAQCRWVFVSGEQRKDGVELAHNCLREGRVDHGETGLQVGEGLLGALNVGGEVDQVDVAVWLFLTGDFGRLHLFEQVGGAVGQVFRLVGERRGEGIQFLHIGGELCGE